MFELPLVAGQVPALPASRVLTISLPLFPTLGGMTLGGTPTRGNATVQLAALSYLVEAVMRLGGVTYVETVPARNMDALSPNMPHLSVASLYVFYVPLTCPSPTQPGVTVDLTGNLMQMMHRAVDRTADVLMHELRRQAMETAGITLQLVAGDVDPDDVDDADDAKSKKDRRASKVGGRTPPPPPLPPYRQLAMTPNLLVLTLATMAGVAPSQHARLVGQFFANDPAFFETLSLQKATRVPRFMETPVNLYETRTQKPATPQRLADDCPEDQTFWAAASPSNGAASPPDLLAQLQADDLALTDDDDDDGVQVAAPGNVSFVADDDEDDDGTSVLGDAPPAADAAGANGDDDGDNATGGRVFHVPSDVTDRGLLSVILPYALRTSDDFERFLSRVVLPNLRVPPARLPPPPLELHQLVMPPAATYRGDEFARSTMGVGPFLLVPMQLAALAQRAYDDLMALDPDAFNRAIDDDPTGPFGTAMAMYQEMAATGAMHIPRRNAVVLLGARAAADELPPAFRDELRQMFDAPPDATSMSREALLRFCAHGAGSLWGARVLRSYTVVLAVLAAAASCNVVTNNIGGVEERVCATTLNIVGPHSQGKSLLTNIVAALMPPALVDITDSKTEAADRRSHNPLTTSTGTGVEELQGESDSSLALLVVGESTGGAERTEAGLGQRKKFSTEGSFATKRSAKRPDGSIGLENETVVSLGGVTIECGNLPAHASMASRVIPMPAPPLVMGQDVTSTNAAARSTGRSAVGGAVQQPKTAVLREVVNLVTTFNAGMGVICNQPLPNTLLCQPLVNHMAKIAAQGHVLRRSASASSSARLVPSVPGFHDMFTPRTQPQLDLMAGTLARMAAATQCIYLGLTRPQIGLVLGALPLLPTDLLSLTCMLFDRVPGESTTLTGVVKSTIKTHLINTALLATDPATFSPDALDTGLAELVSTVPLRSSATLEDRVTAELMLHLNHAYMPVTIRDEVVRLNAAGMFRITSSSATTGASAVAVVWCRFDDTECTIDQLVQSAALAAIDKSYDTYRTAWEEELKEERVDASGARIVLLPPAVVGNVQSNLLKTRKLCLHWRRPLGRSSVPGTADPSKRAAYTHNLLHMAARSPLSNLGIRVYTPPAPPALDDADADAAADDTDDTTGTTAAFCLPLSVLEQLRAGKTPDELLAGATSARFWATVAATTGMPNSTVVTGSATIDLAEPSNKGYVPTKPNDIPPHEAHTLLKYRPISSDLAQVQYISVDHVRTGLVQRPTDLRIRAFPPDPFQDPCIRVVACNAVVLMGAAIHAMNLVRMKPSLHNITPSMSLETVTGHAINFDMVDERVAEKSLDPTKGVVSHLQLAYNASVILSTRYGLAKARATFPFIDTLMSELAKPGRAALAKLLDDRTAHFSFDQPFAP